MVTPILYHTINPFNEFLVDHAVFSPIADHTAGNAILNYISNVIVQSIKTVISKVLHEVLTGRLGRHIDAVAVYSPAVMTGGVDHVLEPLKR